MNIYEKLAKCRVELQSMKIKKSGKNKFAGYEYFELDDIVPNINKLFHDNKMCSFTNFDSESNTATLTIVNSEKPEEIIAFTTRIAGASLKGCHPIQNEGAVITYSRRYLYMNALEVTEKDALDATLGDKNDLSGTNRPKTNKKPSNTPQKSSDNIINKAQLTRLKTIATKSGLSPSDAKGIIGALGYTSSKDILIKDYDVIIAEFETRGKVLAEMPKLLK